MSNMTNEWVTTLQTEVERLAKVTKRIYSVVKGQKGNWRIVRPDGSDVFNPGRPQTLCMAISEMIAHHAWIEKEKLENAQAKLDASADFRDYAPSQPG